jgi:hypothetical protein
MATALATDVATSRLVGRDLELARLVASVDRDRASVTVVHGIPGVGISTLLARFADVVRGGGARVRVLDGRAVAPTPAGFLAAVGASPCGGPAALDGLARSLAATERTVLVVDHWDAARLLDGWIRREVLPRLPATASLVLGSEHPPPPAWLLAAGPRLVVDQVALAPLARTESLELLASLGVGGSDAEQLVQLTGGLPLALRLAAAAARDTPDAAAFEAAFPTVASLIAGVFLDPLAPDLRAAVEALAVVRRGTLDVLRAMDPTIQRTTLGELAALPYVDVTAHGLALHEAVRSPVAMVMRGVDPSRYAAHRRAAWGAVTDQLRRARLTEVGRHTADLLYLVDHPLVRRTFFPPTRAAAPVEAATARDREAVAALARAQLPPTRAETMAGVAAAAPARVRVARSPDGAPAAALVTVDRTALASDLVARDPVAKAVRSHLRHRPVAPSRDVLVVLAAIASTTGEPPGARLAPLWLDLARTCLERGEHLGRVYVAAGADQLLTTFGALGYEPLPGAGDESTDGKLAVLDLGAGGVAGWLSRLAGEQVGRSVRALTFDPDLRRVRCRDGDPVTLSELEFRLLRHLVGLDGRPATRAVLVREVWGHTDAGGSNVVDAVVRTLRRKLGPSAPLVATVRGVGYRYDERAA